jgi:hypothetical protein
MITIPTATPMSNNPIEGEEEDLGEMTEDIALSILTSLKGLMKREDLSVLDLKDITNMFKDVGAFVQRNNANSGSTTKGLDVFLSRLKA